MARISSEFGITVALDPMMKSLVIRGTSIDIDRARALLAEGIAASHEPRPSPLELEDCCICLVEASNPVQTSCGHFYCKECFILQVDSAGDNDFPLHCHGGENGKCGKIFELEELKRLVPSAGFNRLLLTSFESHVKTHPEQYFFCPGTNCESIFRAAEPTLADDQKTIYCIECFSQVCTSCKADHDGLTCAEFRASGTLEFEQFKKDNNIQNCTNCSAPIEKIYGCDHMQCLVCKAHLCWKCMDIFASGPETYRHMIEAHGGLGEELEYENNEDHWQQFLFWQEVGELAMAHPHVYHPADFNVQ